ncbi:MAG TPA: DUF3576 domain-containing protein [Alphaproteobacteria bacterium]
MRHLCLSVALIGLAIATAGCGDTDVPVEATYPSDNPRPPGTLLGKNQQTYYEGNSLFGGDGIVLFGGPNYEPDRSDGAGIGVNSFLWRASLDTLSFMPLVSADPFGGVIITDWYTPPQAPDERFKVSAFILDRSLRADGVRVSVFRQTQQSPGNWVDAPLAESMATDLENAILARARQMRIRTLASQ